MGASAAGDGRPARPPLRCKWPFLAALVLVVICDLATKSWAFGLEPTDVGYPQVRWVAGRWLGLTKTLNPGAVWGLGREFTGILIGVRLLVLAGVVTYLVRLREARVMPVTALGLISGGALGNLYDNFTGGPGGFTWNLLQVFRHPGKVRDFVHVDLGFPPFNPWPDFNVADSMILIGVGLLIIFLPRGENCATADSINNGVIPRSGVEEGPGDP